MMMPQGILHMLYLVFLVWNPFWLACESGGGNPFPSWLCKLFERRSLPKE